MNADPDPGSSTPEAPARARGRRLWLSAAAVIVFVAALLRVAGARGDLWLDEVWSLDLISKASPVDIFIFVNHDNNHWLNSLYLSALGDGQPAFVYRLLSLTTGIGMVVVAGVIGRRYGPLEGLLAMLLVGLSYPMVHYSSEARGYAPAGFFGLAGFALVQSQAADYRGWRSAAFALVAVLGMVSHLTFVLVYGGLAVWSAAAVFRTRVPHPVRALLAMHGFPVLVLAELYFVDVRGWTVGGGPGATPFELLQLITADGLGIPGHRFTVTLTAALIAAAGVTVLAASRRDRPDEWLFFAVTCVVGPAAVILTADRGLAPRYFFVTYSFWLLLLARALARGFRAGPVVRLGCAAAVAVFVVGNALDIQPFLVHGRGQYRAALAFCVEHTPPGVPVTVGGDHDFRVGMLVRYHARFAPEAAGVVYVERREWTPDSPRWLIRHDLSTDPRPDAKVTGRNGVLYVLMASYPYSGHSGLNWYVYRSSEAGLP